MMVSIESYVQRGRGKLRQLAVDPRVRLAGKVSAYFAGGLVLSAASLAHSAQPLVLGLLLALSGWQAALLALGGCAGYLLFWGKAGLQGLLWLGAGLPVALILNRKKITQDVPLLIPAIAGLILSASGLAFQIFLDDTTGVPVYLLRIALAAATSRLFVLVWERRDPVADWLGAGIFVLALAQIAPVTKLSLGYVAGGLLAAGSAFPAAALAGLALDLAQITKVPMTAVLCLAYLTRMLPWKERLMRFGSPGVMYLLVMGLCGIRDPVPAVALAIGGGIAVFLPQAPELSHRRGETGLAQVRLELMAGVMSQTQQLLLESSDSPIDESALLARTQERACGSCPCRKNCRERLEPLPESLLHKPLLDQFSIPVSCKKPARMVMELRRSQEQLRSIKADRDRREEYRWALVQQYQFLSHYLQQQADQLPRRGEKIRQRFSPEVAVCSAGRESANGDRCLWFAGTGGKYYILLCDGMGTGLGAAQEGQTAAVMLRQMLSAGFPAEYALRSVNSLLVLRGRAGAATIDLAEVRLDTGRVSLYKWGAAPSWLIREGVPEKIGTAGPPPGLSVTEGRETVERLSLSRGEVLILTSDGVDGEDALRHVSEASAQPPGEMAAKLLELGCRELEDDATVAVIRLAPGALST
ncbi:MAG: SpoIIE family protein phosphatase [Oscillospiraceae bacterium]|nr:SpoIIE family protein phosphatase [Oscillospiraceae bacterium]